MVAIPEDMVLEIMPRTYMQVFKCTHVSSSVVPAVDTCRWQASVPTRSRASTVHLARRDGATVEPLAQTRGKIGSWPTGPQVSHKDKCLQYGCCPPAASESVAARRSCCMHSARPVEAVVVGACEEDEECFCSAARGTRVGGHA
jgi:hypothetical protein